MDTYDDTVLQRFFTSIQKTETCWLWAGTRSSGYGILYVGRIRVYAHRFSFEIHIGPIPEKSCVLHNCPGGDNPACVCPDHLFLGTQLDNIQDMVQKNRTPRGEHHWSHLHPERMARGDRNGSHTHPESRVRGMQQPMAKLTDDDVREIHRRFRASHGRRGIGAELAHDFTVSRQTISDILREKMWTHVKD